MDQEISRATKNRYKDLCKNSLNHSHKVSLKNIYSLHSSRPKILALQKSFKYTKKKSLIDSSFLPY